MLEKQSQQKSAHDGRSHSRAWIAGDRVLVRNHHDGPDWILGTIIEVLGPVTYLVETDSGQKWKRHTDQIKDWLSPAPRVAQETEQQNSDTDTFDTASEVSSPADDPTDSSSSGEPGAGTPNGHASTESPLVTEETSPPEAEQSTTTTSSGTIPRRYPSRARQPPNRYDPAGFETNHVVVI